MIFSKKYKVHWQKFQKYDYYIFQLKWSLCQRTEMGGGGEGRMTAGSSGSGPLLEMPCVRQRAVIGQSRRICFSRQTERRSSGAQEEVLRCGAAARHPEDHSKEALSGHSPTSPHSDSTTDWPDWLSSGCQRPLTLQSLEPPKRARITIFGVTVIITLI